jgi:hypothetical protein
LKYNNKFCRDFQSENAAGGFARSAALGRLFRASAAQCCQLLRFLIVITSNWRFRLRSLAAADKLITLPNQHFSFALKGCQIIKRGLCKFACRLGDFRCEIFPSGKHTGYWISHILIQQRCLLISPSTINLSRDVKKTSHSQVVLYEITSKVC